MIRKEKIILKEGKNWWEVVRIGEGAMGVKLMINNDFSSEMAMEIARQFKEKYGDGKAFKGKTMDNFAGQEIKISRFDQGQIFVY